MTGNCRISDFSERIFMLRRQSRAAAVPVAIAVCRGKEEERDVLIIVVRPARGGGQGGWMDQRKGMIFLQEAAFCLLISCRHSAFL